MFTTPNRRYRNYPYRGRKMLCGDTLGIVDAWQTSDAAALELERGQVWCSYSPTIHNTGSISIFGAQPSTQHHIPAAGIHSGIPFLITGNGVFSSRFPGEINPNHNAARLDLTWRFLSQAEYATITTLSNGQGYRCQRLRVWLFNGVGQSTPILDIFQDWAWYKNNVTGAIPPQSADHVVDLALGVYLPTDGMLQYTISETGIAALARTNRALAGYLLVTNFMERDGNGAAWSGVSEIARFDALPCPVSAVGYAVAGAVSVNFETHHDPSLPLPNLTEPPGLFNRAASRLLGLPLSMGDTMAASLLAGLQTDLLVAKKAAFTSLNIGGGNMGGHYYPIAGDSFVFADTPFMSFDIQAQLPNQCSGFVACAWLRTIALPGTHLVKVEFLHDYAVGQWTQTVISQTYSTTTAERLFYTWGALPQVAQATSGQVEQITIRITVEKTTPRPGTIQDYLWDGLGSLWLGFYD